MRLRRGSRSSGAAHRVNGDSPPATPYTFESTVDSWAREIAVEARPYTMTSAERLVAVIDATKYIVDRDVRGALVECGVWRGGSVLAMVRTLQHLGVDDRDFYLFDTFEGMTAPTPEDTSQFEAPAQIAWESATQHGERPWNDWFDHEVFNLDSLRAMLESSGYPGARLHFVRGPVEETVPANAPGAISLLRLDTDWYESTKHELMHLYPRLVHSGVLIIDDYGHWQGCRQAVDEYFASQGEPLLLSRIDYTGRLAIKA